MSTTLPQNCLAAIIITDHAVLTRREHIHSPSITTVTSIAEKQVVFERCRPGDFRVETEREKKEENKGKKKKVNSLQTKGEKE